jgi:quercetin dioxygenase-like cupin family protein
MTPINTGESHQAEVFHHLLEDLVEDALPIERANKLQTRLQARLQQDLMLRRASKNSEVFVQHKDQGEWEAFVPGIRIKYLRRSGATHSYLLQLAAGGILPPHRHNMIEECVVLEGNLRLRNGKQVLQIGKGAFHLAPQGEDHPSICSENGALIYLRGAATEAKDINWWNKGALAALAPESIKHWFHLPA